MDLLPHVRLTKGSPLSSHRVDDLPLHLHLWGPLGKGQLLLHPVEGRSGPRPVQSVGGQGEADGHTTLNIEHNYNSGRTLHIIFLSLASPGISSSPSPCLSSYIITSLHVYI